MKRTIDVLWFCLLLLPALYTQATWGETVTAQLGNGSSAVADYRQGAADKPAILVMHGFLTTNGFSTVQVVVNELADAGYTVLAPTLTLGINNRNTSLPCDAIHTHTMDGDLAEIDFWTRWLAAKGARKIILIGHSSGGLQQVIYVAIHPHPAVSRVIAISLINFQQYTAPDIIARERKGAEQLLHQQPPPLRTYQMVYCSKYNATPAAYLSYIRWSREAVLTTLKQRKVPIYAIMGGSDDRFSSEWFEKLRSTGIGVKVIPQANHFFNGPQEFDLLDELKRQLNETPSPRTKQ